jgi:hypothetical protein
LKSSATWYGIGFLTAKMWNRIEGPVYKYILNPIASFTLRITNFFSNKQPLFGENSIIGKVLTKTHSLF